MTDEGRRAIADMAHAQRKHGNLAVAQALYEMLEESERFEAFLLNLQALLDADAAGIPPGAERIPGHVRLQLEAMIRWESEEERESLSTRE